MISFNKSFIAAISTLMLLFIGTLRTDAQILGCTSPQACNFDPAANLDDESCVFPQWYLPADIAGINPALQACSPPLGYVLADQGCVATIVANDPYCVNTDWDNICENAYNICVFGCAEVVDCLDPNACNYDPSGICDRGLCTYPGCTDPSAYNYNPAAGCDNETCNFFNECGNPIFYGNGQGIDFVGYMDPANWIVDTNGGNGSVVFNPTTLNITGNNAGGNGLFSEATVVSPVAGNVSFNWSWITSDLPQFDPAFIEIDGVVTQLTSNVGATSQSGQFIFAISAGSTVTFYVNATDGCCGAATLTISSFQWPGNCIVGCTNELACNYDPNANQDSGLCIFGPANDEPGNPTPFNVQDDVTTSVFQNLENACTSSNFNCNGTLMNNDVWFSFASTGGPLRIIAFSTEFLLTPALALYEDPNALPISCNNFANVAEGPGGIGSELIFNCRELDAGTTYYLQVGGAFIYNGTVGIANIRVLQSSFTEGCMNPLACNFDPNASCDPGGICTFPGCNNTEACNFNPEAGCDDGSCKTLDCFGECGGIGVIDGCGNCVYGIIKEKVFLYQGVAHEYVVPDNVFYISVELYGAPGGTAEFGQFSIEGGKGGFSGGILQVTPGETLYINTGGKGNGIFGGYNGGGNGFLSNLSGSEGSGGGGATDVRTSEFDLSTRLIVAGGGGGSSILRNNNAEQITIKSGGSGGGQEGEGVSNGIDFIPGGTQFSAGPGGSLGAGADVTSNIASAGGGGGYYGGGTDQINRSGGSGGSGFLHPSLIDGITGVYDNAGDGFAIFRIFEIPECIPGCTAPNASNYNPLATSNDGTCEFLGCNDPDAENFNPFAFINDGSCIYMGCTYPDAENFNPGANSDDGSCTFSLGGNDCAEDITGDGLVNTADLLALLAAFGTTCP